MKQTIFKDSIFFDTFSNEELHNKIKNILEQEKISKRHNYKSNEGGFQTINIKSPMIEKQIVDWSSIIINEELFPHKPIKISLLNLWINENNKNNYNSIHVHPSSHLSGIYYIDVPLKSGNLFFYKYANDFLNLSSFFKKNFIINMK